MIGNDELRRIYGKPANRRLKRIALGIGFGAIALLLSTIFCGGGIPWPTMCILRGCAELLSLMFVVVVAILVYRVNREYILWRPEHDNVSEKQS